MVWHPDRRLYFYIDLEQAAFGLFARQINGSRLDPGSLVISGKLLRLVHATTHLKGIIIN